MLAKILLTMTVFGGLLGAMGADDADVFTVRSFTNPNVKKRIPTPEILSPQGLTPQRLTLQILGDNGPNILASVARTSSSCAIPLLEAKAAPAPDKIGRAMPPISDAIAKAPPVPECKDWK